MKIPLVLIGLALALTACSGDIAPAPGKISGSLNTDAGLSAASLTTQGVNRVSPGGVFGKYFRASGFVDFDHLQVDPTIERVWLPRAGSQASYSVRWNALLTAPQAEPYTFTLTGLSRARLYLDGVLLIDLTALRGPKSQEATVVLAGSERPSTLHVEYDHTGSLPGLIRLEWRSAHQRREVIPSRALTPVDLTADCPSVLSKACLPKFVLASSHAAVALIGPGSIHGSLDIENKSDLYPLNIRVSSQAFPQFDGQYQVPPSAILPVDLPFECTVPGATNGMIAVTRIEDGVAVQTDAFLGCGETFPGPIVVGPPSAP